MSRIFISYSTQDRKTAAALAAAIQGLGYSVWWDRNMAAGESFDARIEKELTAASCAIVVWSDSAVKSAWVKGEARIGLKRGILIPIVVESVEQPIDFRDTHAADFTRWNGKPNSPQFLALAENIKRKLHVGGISTLSKTELMIARRFVGGESISAIGLSTGLSSRTITTFITSAYRKLNAKDKLELAKVLNGWV